MSVNPHVLKKIHTPTLPQLGPEKGSKKNPAQLSVTSGFLVAQRQQIITNQPDGSGCESQGNRCHGLAKKWEGTSTNLAIEGKCLVAPRFCSQNLFFYYDAL